jgi:hypothetical protein
MNAEGRVIRAQRDQVAPRPDVRVARLAAAQWGVVSAGELRELGIWGNAVSARVRRGWLHPLHRGVYAVGHANPPLQGLFLAAVKACGVGAVLSHFAAGAVLDLVRWDGRAPEVTVLGRTRRLHSGIRVHRTDTLTAADVVVRDRTPMTSPARTLVDLAACLDARQLRRAVRHAQSLKRVTLRQLAETHGRLGPRRGSAKLAAILASGPAPTRSELEDVVLDLLLDGGLPKPDVNVPLTLDGRTVIPDFRWPDRKLVVEADSTAWHDNKLAREDDAERQALLEAHGERVLRVTWDDAVSRRGQTLRRVWLAFGP